MHLVVQTWILIKDCLGLSKLLCEGGKTCIASVYIFFGNSGNLTCEQSLSWLQDRILTHNGLEKTQDALEYIHEEKCISRNSNLFKKCILLDFRRLLEDIGTEGWNVCHKLRSSRLLNLRVKGLQILRIGPVWVPFRAAWKYDVKKETLL